MVPKLKPNLQRRDVRPRLPSPVQTSRSHQRGSVVVKKRIKPRALNFRSVPVAAFPHVRPASQAGVRARFPVALHVSSLPSHGVARAGSRGAWVAVRYWDAGDPGRPLVEDGGSLRASWLVLVL
jgi:hypothetical protein